MENLQPKDAEQLIKEATEISDFLLKHAGEKEARHRKQFIVFNTQNQPARAKANYDISLRAAAPDLRKTPTLKVTAELDRSGNVKRVEICLSTKNPESGAIDPWISLFLPKDRINNYDAVIYWEASTSPVSFRADTMQIPADARKMIEIFFPCLRAAQRVLELQLELQHGRE